MQYIGKSLVHTYGGVDVAIKASDVQGIQVRPYTKALRWVVVVLKNGRALDATKSLEEVAAIQEAAARNNVRCVVLS